MARNSYSWRYFLNDYFIFSKGQRRALVILGLFILLAAVFPYGYNWYFERNKAVALPFIIKEIAELKIADNSLNKYSTNSKKGYSRDTSISSVKPNTLFFFDPNTATPGEWRKLGIQEKTIGIIVKYREKGGRFRQPADIQKIYGLSQFEKQRLLPYIKIEQGKYQSGNNITGVSAKDPFKKEKHFANIDINSADTTAFKNLPGIGSKLAGRIVKYREALGGFLTVKQVSEVYGIHDSVFLKIEKFLIVRNVVIHKRNINTASAGELRFPYLPGNVANAIVEYRNKNGPFSSILDLKKILIVDDDLFVKIHPYMTIE